MAVKSNICMKFRKIIYITNNFGNTRHSAVLKHYTIANYCCIEFIDVNKTLYIVRVEY